MTGQAVQNIERIRELANNGLTRSEISAALDLCQPYVSELAKRAGVEFERKQSPLIEKIKRLAANGRHRQQIADELGTSYQYVAALGAKHGIEFVRQPYPGQKDKPDTREYQMAALYTRGETLQEIGTEFGITRERVRQLLAKFFNISRKDGGQSKRSAHKLSRFEERRNAKSQARWGCSWVDYVKLRTLRKPVQAFGRQKTNAILRGIEWNLTLWQWWTIWQESGHWDDRGVGRGYCMCRKGDQGSYSVDNVYIATGIKNIQDYWADVKSGARERRSPKPRAEQQVSP